MSRVATRPTTRPTWSAPSYPVCACPREWFCWRLLDKKRAPHSPWGEEELNLRTQPKCGVVSTRLTYGRDAQVERQRLIAGAVGVAEPQPRFSIVTA